MLSCTYVKFRICSLSFWKLLKSVLVDSSKVRSLVFQLAVLLAYVIAIQPFQSRDSIKTSISIQLF